MLDIVVADRKRTPAMRTANIDVQVGGLDVAGLKHHDPKTQSAGLRSRRQGRVGSPKASFVWPDLGHWAPPFSFTLTSIVHHFGLNEIVKFWVSAGQI
jgi:hypothetical protein